MNKVQGGNLHKEAVSFKSNSDNIGIFLCMASRNCDVHDCAHQALLVDFTCSSAK